MAGMTTRPGSMRLTRADLADVPDDGYRYEIIDGELFVNAAPSRWHQVVSGNLHLLLRAACPAELQVLYAPFAVALAEDTEIQPDLIVARRSDLTDADLPTAPVLAIEILSPSTRRLDLVLKRDRLERAACPSYWIVDPREPRLTVWELVDGRFVQVADVGPDETWHAARPYPVAITPRSLLD